MLTMLCRAFPKKVTCYASRSAMPHLATSECLSTKIVYANSANGKSAVLFRYLTSLLYNIWILLRSSHKDLLFYNYNNVFCLRILDLINRFKKATVVICCHGEMEFLSLDSSHDRAYKRLMSWLVNGYFNKNNHNPAEGMYFMVLGDRIIKNVSAFISEELQARFLTIDHPVLPIDCYGENYCVEKSTKKKNKSNMVNLGTVGILNQHKGSELFLQLIQSLSNDSHKLKFHIIGHMQCEDKQFRQFGVKIPQKPEEPLPEESFMREVNKLDFILYFYTSDKYKLTASGAILDALRFRKPIIALRNDYFEYFFEKFGAVGYLVDSVDEMASLIRDIDQLNREFDFKNIAEKLKLESLQPCFDSIIKPLAR